MRSQPPTSFNEAAHMLVHDKSCSVAQLAEAIGVTQGQLYNSVLESAPTAKFQAEWITTLTVLTGNYVLVDYLARTLRGVFVHGLAVSVNPAKDLRNQILEITVSLGSASAEITSSLQADSEKGAELSELERKRIEATLYKLRRDVAKAHRLVMEAGNR